MTYCTGIRLTNFARFRGTHEVSPLEPKAYAIVARLDTDEARSNWLGKSSLVVALRYLLFGVLPKDDYETLDHAISRGENDMAVDAEFSDGSFISRARVRGKYATLRFVSSDGAGAEVETNQDAAQQAIEKWLGMDVDTYDACSHIAQKQADQFARLKGAALADIVNEWVGLEKVVHAHEICGASLAALTRQLQTIDRELEQHAWATPEAGALLRQQVGDAQLNYGVQKSLQEERLKLIRADAAWRQHAVNHVKHQALTAALTRLEEQPPQHIFLDTIGEAEEALGKAREQAAPLRARVNQLEVVARGEFDGRCPVAKIQCPARQQINNDRAGGNVQLVEAKAEWSHAAASVTQSIEKLEVLQATARVRREWESATVRLREQIEALRDSANYIAQHGQPPEEEPELIDTNDSELRRLKSELGTWEATQPIQAAQHAARAPLVARIAAFRVASLVLGPEGVQRRLAEGAVQSVERGANERLERAGVELSVEFRWGRETKKPATRCTECGTAYPASARPKQCVVCGAPRGQEVDPKPYLKLSNRSGAAEDMAGVALTLARSCWVRARRESQWSVIILDEVFSALDQANSRALAGHVNQLVSDGFAQSFLVAHSRMVLESLPGRIEVTGSGDWSSVRVVA